MWDWMYGCESWAIKKAERWRINAFEPWCWRRLFRVPWTAKRSSQCILKEISPEYSLEGLMLKLKLQYFDHLMQRTDSSEKILMLGKIEGRRKRVNRGWDGWMASPTQLGWVWVNSGSWCWTGRPGVLQSMGSQSQTQLSAWTELSWKLSYISEITLKIVERESTELDWRQDWEKKSPISFCKLLRNLVTPMRQVLLTNLKEAMCNVMWSRLVVPNSLWPHGP